MEVTPYVGVWIEIDITPEQIIEIMVTPDVGVWIEIECALDVSVWKIVTPYVGVWIEIFLRRREQFMLVCHPLCGGVD